MVCISEFTGHHLTGASCHGCLPVHCGSIVGWSPYPAPRLFRATYCCSSEYVPFPHGTVTNAALPLVALRACLYLPMPRDLRRGDLSGGPNVAVYPWYTPLPYRTPADVTPLLTGVCARVFRQPRLAVPTNRIPAQVNALSINSHVEQTSARRWRLLRGPTRYRSGRRQAGADAGDGRMGAQPWCWRLLRWWLACTRVRLILLFRRARILGMVCILVSSAPESELRAAGASTRRRGLRDG
jgi:hypothetical protein